MDTSKAKKKEEFIDCSSANRCPGTSWQAQPQHAGLLLEKTNAITINVPPLSSFPRVFIAEHMMTYGTEYPFDHLDSAVPALLHSNLLPAYAFYTLCWEVQIIFFRRQDFFLMTYFQQIKKPSKVIKELQNGFAVNLFPPEHISIMWDILVSAFVILGSRNRAVTSIYT